MRNFVSKPFNQIFKLIITVFFLLISSVAVGEGYQELSPTSVYSGDNGALYIVMANNIGLNGCSINKNNILINPSESSGEYVKSALSITLAAIATGKSIKVYWNGCLVGGRPKATLIGLGITEIN